MNFLRKACRVLFRALEWFAMICMVVLTVIVFTDVILRYIFKQGFSWTQEIATLMLVWFSLIGMAIGVLEKSTSASRCSPPSCLKKPSACWRASTTS